MHASKQLHTVLLTLILTLALPATASAAMPYAVDGQPLPSLAPLVREVGPAVVNIQVRSTQRNPFFDDPLRRRFFGGPNAPSEREVQGQGSGVIVDAENGYIITNHHVVNEAKEIQVTLHDDRTLDAEIVGTDAGSDIAVLKVSAKNLVEMSFGNSDDLEVGDFVIAIGNPFGLSNTVTTGIVSALGRMGIGGGEQYEDFIQTDASINPGNSGGALVNLRGELVGVNSAIISPRAVGNIGIGFAIPSNMTQSIMRQLLEFGEVRRGLLGVSINTINEDNAEEFGVKNVGGAVIMSVEPESAADKAGLQVGDIVTAVNGRKIDSSNELSNSIGLLAAGDEVEITLLREGKARTLKATLGSRTSMAASSGTGDDIHPGLAGATFAAAGTASGRSRGVEITAVEPGSPADRWQLAAGDVILQVNRQPVSTVAELREVAEEANVLWILMRRGDLRIMRQIR